eukprot:GSMAST32.ASY1.ANO1.251.1 assembled CDS
MSALLNLVASPLHSALTSALQALLSKYVKNVDLRGIGVTDDIVLHNLELRLDVFQESVFIPMGFKFVRGFIKELRISIPWLNLMSQPVSVYIKTVECILEAGEQPNSEYKSDEEFSSGTESNSDNDIDANQTSRSPSSGWIQKTLVKLLANVKLQVNDLVFKYICQNTVCCVALKSLHVFSADPYDEWAPRVKEPEGPSQTLHKVLELIDVTVMLDQYEEGQGGLMTRNRTLPLYEEIPILSRTSLGLVCFIFFQFRIYFRTKFCT